MNWRAVTFTTQGTGYEREVLRLKASCEALSIPLRIFTYANLGSWRANLNFKSQSIIDAMAYYPDRDIVFVDADAVVRSYPTLFDELSERRVSDIAVHFLADRELLSGTLWLRNDERGMEIAQRWHDVAKRTPQQRHQQCLAIALRALRDEGRPAKICRLPIEYTCIFDHPLRRGKTAVIEHFQASRRYRRLLDGPRKPVVRRPLLTIQRGAMQ